MADKVQTYKTVVKEIATRHGVYATFMPKPIATQNGSGMHTHQSLFQNSENAFFDADDQYFLSNDGKAFIAGQLRHAREISIVFAQYVNSYKRLVPGYEAPVYIAWSRRNRSALVRVPLYHPGQEKAQRAELRCPDPAANIYLCFAALLHAGLEGIEKGYELPEPMERNLYDLSHEERQKMGIQSLPADLGEAIKEAEESELLQKALGEHVYSRLLEVKRWEFEDYRVQVTPYEIQNFLPIL
jgi:glutamine synthetase